MKVIALLPLKAESQRVKNKNWRHLGDRALFRWIYDTLVGMPSIDQVVVNTDLDLFPMPANPGKVLCRRRWPHLCGHDVPMNAIIADDLAATDGDLYIQTHATNPFLSAKTIQTAIDFMASTEERDSLFGVNVLKSRLYMPGHFPINHDPSKLIPTQDLDPIYEENSTIYAFTKESFGKRSDRIGENPYPFETPPLESIDIDTEDDWTIAEALAAAS